MIKIPKTNKQKFVIVTGAAGGIGKAIVKEFAANGYTVIGTDRVPSPQDLDAHHYLLADLARAVDDVTYADEFFLQIKRLIGTEELSALINNAAIQILGKSDHLSRKDWHSTLNVNLLAPFFLAQSLLPELERAYGCVLNIGSIHAHLTKPGFLAYSTSKAALRGLTKSMAVDLGNRIRVNGIEPAAISTAMLTAGFSQDQEGLRLLSKYHPTNSIGTPEDLAVSIRSLIEIKSPFLNGATLSFDGGISSRLHDPC